MANSLFIVHVDVAVIPDQIRGFLDATEENAMASRKEPGVVRFDVLTDRSDPGHVVLVEVYKDEAAAAAHKETGHYERWRDIAGGDACRVSASDGRADAHPARVG